MQESLSQITPIADPLSVLLTPRDIFALHTACEASIVEMDDCGFGKNELRTRIEDLEQRFRHLLKSGGHVK